MKSNVTQNFVGLFRGVNVTVISASIDGAGSCGKQDLFLQNRVGGLNGGLPGALPSPGRALYGAVVGERGSGWAKALVGCGLARMGQQSDGLASRRRRWYDVARKVGPGRRTYRRSVLGENQMGRIRFIVLVMLVPLCAVVSAEEEQQSASESVYEQLCRAVVRLERLRRVGEDGAQEYGFAPNGTGFFVRRENDLYIVSARHVVEKPYPLVARVRLRDSGTGEMSSFLLILPREGWSYHPEEGDPNNHYVDVAAIKVSTNSGNFPKYFEYGPQGSAREDKNNLALTDAEPPQPVLVLGFPGSVGLKLLEQRPMARSGIISMTAGKRFLRWRADRDDPNSVKFGDERCCLLDVVVRAGNSGSPVMNWIGPGGRGFTLFGLVIADSESSEYAIMEPASRIRETLEVARTKPAAGSWTPISVETESTTDPNTAPTGM